MDDILNSSPTTSPGTSSKGGLPTGSASLPCDIEGSGHAVAHLGQMQERLRLAENGLRESEERYQMLLSGGADYAIFMMDPNGVIVSWNSGAERIKGYTADQIIGRSFSCFFSPEDLQSGLPDTMLQLAARNGRHQEYAVRVRKGGCRFLASVTLTALRGAAGEHLGFWQFSHDLSESVNSNVKYMEAASDAMVVSNSGGKIVLVNRRAEKLFRYPRDELLGQTLETIIPHDFVTKAGPLARDKIARRGRANVAMTGRRKDGGEFPIEIIPSPLGRGEHLLVTTVIRDVSVWRGAERRLAQAEDRYRGLLEAAPDAMVVMNAGGEIVLVNREAERQFGYLRDELVGQRVKTIIPQGLEERPLVDSLGSAAEASMQRMGGGIELTGRRKDASEFPIEIMVSPLGSPEGLLVTAAIRDITTRKKGEAELRLMAELERTQSEFVSTVSHELRTPLTSIGASLALIAGGAVGAVNDRASRLIQIARNNTQRLIALVNDILDIEKLQSGRMVFEFAPMRLDDVVDQAISDNQGYAATFGVELRRVGVASDVSLNADSSRLMQAITNLISNAVKFSAPDACVDVSTLLTDLGVRISVSDQGAGIPETFRARVFERFAQADSSDTRQKGGSGLGLNIVREFVQRMGGSASFESVVDRGSTFHLDFPRTTFHLDGAMAGGPSLQTHPANDQGQAGKAIVCAPSAAVADPICEILRAIGVEFDLVLTDKRGLAYGAGKPAIKTLPLCEDGLDDTILALGEGEEVDRFPVVLFCVPPEDPESSAPKPIPFPEAAPLQRAADGESQSTERPDRQKAAILHIEDERILLEIVRDALEEEFKIVSAETLESARRHLIDETFDLIILDLTLSDGLGRDLIPHLRDRAGRPIPIVAYTGSEPTPELVEQVGTVLTKSRDNLAKLVETVRTTIAATRRNVRSNNEDSPHEAA